MLRSLLLLSIGSRGHVDLCDRMDFIFCHVGCPLKIGARMCTGLNLDLYDRGDPSWASRAFCKSPSNLRVRTRKFFLAALTERSNSNIGFKGWRHGVAIVCCRIEMRLRGQTIVLSFLFHCRVLPKWRLCSFTPEWQKHVLFCLYL